MKIASNYYPISDLGFCYVYLLPSRWDLNKSIWDPSATTLPKTRRHQMLVITKPVVNARVRAA